MNKKLLLFCVTMLASVTMFAQNWDKPEVSNYKFVSEMKVSQQANAPYWEGDTTIYYLFNMEAGGFLSNANCPTHAPWATHASLKIGAGNKVMIAKYRLDPIIVTDTTYVNVEGEEEPVMKVDTVSITIPEWDGVTYKILDYYSGAWRGVFPTSTYNMFVDRNGQADYMWNIKHVGNGVYNISVSDLNPTWNSHYADSIFGNPETYLGFNKLDNDYDPTLEDAAVVMPLTPMLSVTNKAYNPDAAEGEQMEDAELCIDWKFMAEEEFNKYASHLKAWNYLNDGKLDEYIDGVEEKYGNKVDLSKVKAILNSTSPVLYEDLEAAIAETDQAIRDYLITVIFADASDDNPVNITVLMENASLEKRNKDGWDITAGIGDNLKYQETDGNFTTFTINGESLRGYYNNETGSWISGFIEAWLPSPGKLGNGTISQTIKGLPAGKYSFTCDAIACNQSAGKQENVGVYLFAEGGGVSMKTPISTANETPENFELTFVSGGGDIVMGLMSLNADANWMAADNFELWYYGAVEGDPFEAILKTNIARYDKEYPDVDALMANQEIKDAYSAELATAKSCTADFQQEDSILAIAYNNLKQSVADYVRMESLMEEVYAKAEAFQDSDFPGLGEILGEYYEFTLLQAYNECTADAAMIDTIAATMGKMIVEHITANVKAGDELTPLISNPAFDNNFSGWSTTGARPAFGGKGANGLNQIGDVQKLESGNAEVYHAAFDMFQIVRNMPKGSFKLTCQAYERNDGGWENHWAEGPEVGITAYLYANEFTQKVNHIMVGAQDDFVYRANDSDGYPSDTHSSTWSKYVPNSMDGANFYFNLGEDHQMYLVEVNFTLPEAGDSIRIGLKNTATNSWVIFDNFRLYYNGDDASAYAEAIEKLTEKLNNVFENGIGGKDAEQKVADALKGLADAVASNNGDKCLEAITVGTEALAYAQKSIEDYAALETAWNDLSEVVETYAETASPEVLAQANAVFDKIQSALEKMNLTNEEAEELIDQATYYISAVKIPDTTGASPENPIDLSEVIVNNSFDTQDDFSGWSGSGFGSGGTKSTNAERYSMGFDTYQDIAGLPAGYYVAYVQAFYRHGSSGDDYSKFTGASESTKEAYFYVTTSEGTVETEVAYCSSAAVPQTESWVSGGTSTVGTGLVIPNTMLAMNVWSQQTTEEAGEFDRYTKKAKYYNHLIQTKVGEDGKLRIGVKKDGNVGSDWFICDNFRLYYVGANADPAVDSGIENIVANEKAVVGIYNLAGQKLSAPMKGFNIINGKKYFVK